MSCSVIGSLRRHSAGLGPPPPHPPAARLALLQPGLGGRLLRFRPEGTPPPPRGLRSPSGALAKQQQLHQLTDRGFAAAETGGASERASTIAVICKTGGGGEGDLPASSSLASSPQMCALHTPPPHVLPQPAFAQWLCVPTSTPTPGLSLQADPPPPRLCYYRHAPLGRLQSRLAASSAMLPPPPPAITVLLLLVTLRRPFGGGRRRRRARVQTNPVGQQQQQEKGWARPGGGFH